MKTMRVDGYIYIKEEAQKFKMVPINCVIINLGHATTFVESKWDGEWKPCRYNDQVELEKKGWNRVI